MDIPKVDIILQYDPPDDPRDYIHRVGRTARAGKVGKSLLFLLESELGFLRYLKEAKVPLNEFSFPAEKIKNIQSQVCHFFVLSFLSDGMICSSKNSFKRIITYTILRKMLSALICNPMRHIH